MSKARTETRKRYMREQRLTTVVVLAALIFSHQVIYKLLIVPHLSDWKEIPDLYYWLAAAPVVCSTLYLGSRALTRGELSATVLNTIISSYVFIVAMSFAEQPGFSGAVTNARAFADVGFGLITLLYCVLLGAGYGGGKAVRKWMDVYLDRSTQSR